MRVLAACAVLALLIQLLLVPSRHSEDALRERLAAERASAEAIFGSAAAAVSWQRAQAWHRWMTDGLPLFEEGLVATGAPQGRVAAGMGALRERLWGNAYFRAMRMLLRLGCLRMALLAQTGPSIALLAVAALMDGWTARRLRRVLVRPERPERFAFAAMAWLVCLWATFALAAAPLSLPASTLPVVLAIAALLSGQVLAWHHGATA